MMRLWIGAFVLLSLGAFASAQPRDRSASDRDLKVDIPGKDAGSGRTKSCPEFGPGFVRIPGSSSCVRTGGSISVGTGISR
jgi:hypothetical protein